MSFFWCIYIYICKYIYSVDKVGRNICDSRELYNTFEYLWRHHQNIVTVTNIFKAIFEVLSQKHATFSVYDGGVSASINPQPTNAVKHPKTG